MTMLRYRPTRLEPVARQEHRALPDLEAPTLGDLVRSALEVEGAHHKQWYLWRIAEMLGMYVQNEVWDRGTAP